MSDRYTGIISIPKKYIETIPELKEAVHLEFYDPNGNLYDKENWNENSPIADFKCDDARYGQFDELETLCVKLKVPFDRWSAAFTEGPISVKYRPDSNNNRPIYLDGYIEDIVYPASTLQELAQGLNLDNPNNYYELGKIFARFLKKIPQFRSLQEYVK